MASSLCPLCEHSNPAGAKFCNDCGSPLHLEPCSQCSAINDHAIKNCYKCGAQLAATTEPAPTSSSTEALSRARRLEVLRESAAEAVKAFAACQMLDKAAAIESPHSTERWKEAVERSRQERDAKAAAIESPHSTERWKEAVERARQQRDADGMGFAPTTILGPSPGGARPEVTPVTPVGGVIREGPQGGRVVLPSAPLGATQMVSLPKLAVPAPKLALAPSYRKSRAPLIAVLIFLASVSAYYVNRNSAQLKLWLGVSEPRQGVLVTAEPGRSPSFSPPAKIGLAPSSPPAPGLGTANVANVRPAATEASAKPTSQLTAEPDEHADTLAAAHDGISDDPARPPAPRSDPAKPVISSAIGVKGTYETKQPATSRFDVARPASGRSTTRSFAAAIASPRPRATESMGDTPRDAPRVSVCTEAVAALGFCNLKAADENK